MKILILEDNKDRVKSFRLLFLGHIVHVTDHAKDAIELLKANEYDLICLDHDLGGLEMAWDDKNCGMVVAQYMRDNDIQTETIVHSYNNVRGPAMASIIPNARYLPGFWLTPRTNIKFKGESYVKA